MASQEYSQKITGRPRDWASIRPASLEDVPAIQNIYKEVYKGTYSYLEYTDASFLRQDMMGGLSSWYVIEDNTRHSICGCVSAAVDPGSLKAYSRGMMLRPAWQGYGGTARLFGTAFQHMLQRYKGQLRVVWGEARSASIKPQAVAENIGMKPLGILPDKDVFFGRRETAIIMAVYSTAAWLKRDPRVRLVQGLEPLYRHVQGHFKQMRNDPVAFVLVPASRAHPDPQKVFVKTQECLHGYVKYTFTCPTTPSSLEITVNKHCMNAEHMVLRCTTPDEAKMLLGNMISDLKDQGVHFIEGLCPAFDPGLQQAFLSAGMLPTGYLPAWSKDVTSGLDEDRIVFIWSSRPVDRKNMSLSNSAMALANVCFGEAVS